MSKPYPKWKEHWHDFQSIMESRLDQGHKEYGDGSFTRSPQDLLEELAQETLDIVGWGFILWCRLEELKARANQREAAEQLTGIHLHAEACAFRQFMGRKECDCR